MAQAALSKIDQQWGDPRHVKSASWPRRLRVPRRLGGNAASMNWGINGDPVRYLPKCLYLTMMLEVERSFGAMVGKVYI